VLATILEDGEEISEGVDPAANGYQGLRDWVQKELLKVRQ
jgi:hypothetical protein